MDNYKIFFFIMLGAAVFLFAYYKYAQDNESIPLMQPVQLVLTSAAVIWMLCTDFSTASHMGFCLSLAAAFVINYILLDKRVFPALLYTLWQGAAFSALIIALLVLLSSLLGVSASKKK